MSVSTRSGSDGIKGRA